jgi:hypothetical protein
MPHFEETSLVAAPEPEVRTEVLSSTTNYRKSDKPLRSLPAGLTTKPENQTLS